MVRLLTCATVLSLTVTGVAQMPVERERARAQNRLGWELMKGEQFEDAANTFRQAVEIDPSFEMPWYGLGRAHLALRQYVSAVSALVRCRELYVAQVGRQFSSQQDAQRYRSDRITEIDDMIRRVQSGPQTLQTQDQLRQLQDHKRQLQDIIARGHNVTIERAVPAWVSLSLGSAYFRSGKLADAEREYKAAVDADRRSGEAHSNLAVVYLETGRHTDALAALESAKKTGFRVNPELENAIRAKK